MNTFERSRSRSISAATDRDTLTIHLSDEDAGKPVLIPVPVPVYIPVPMRMYSVPTPYPLPIPIPIPVPCFIPTTKKSADSILRHVKVRKFSLASEQGLILLICRLYMTRFIISASFVPSYAHCSSLFQEIQERIPADPFEAELLMMAEAVATETKSDSSSSDEDDASESSTLSILAMINFSARNKETIESPSKLIMFRLLAELPVVSNEIQVQAQEVQVAAVATAPAQGGEFSEDMLQMALRMASEMPDEPVLDLEDSLNPTPIQPGKNVTFVNLLY